MEGLLRRTALPVDRHAGDMFWQPCRKPGQTGDIAHLRPDRIRIAKDDVINRAGVYPRAFNQLRQNMRRDVDRMQRGKTAVAPADRRPHCLDDESFRHRLSFDQTALYDPGAPAWADEALETDQIACWLANGRLVV